MVLYRPIFFSSLFYVCIMCFALRNWLTFSNASVVVLLDKNN